MSFTEDEWQQKLKDVPPLKSDPNSWPKGVRPLTLDEEGIGVDASGVLYWNGKPVMMRRQFELRWFELTLAILVAAGTVAQAAAAIWSLLR